MSFSVFISESTKKELHEAGLATLANNVKNWSLNKVDGKLADLGAGAAKGRIDTRKMVAKYIEDFERYTGQKGIKKPMKDDLVSYMRSKGMKLSDEQYLKMVYGPDASDDFSGRDIAEEHLKKLESALQSNEDIRLAEYYPVIEHIKRRASSAESSAFVRNALLNLRRKYPKKEKLYRAFGLDQYTGSTRLGIKELQTAFTEIARNTSPEPKQKGKKDKAAKASSDNNNKRKASSAKDSLESGQTFKIIQNKFNISADKLYQLSQEDDAVLWAFCKKFIRRKDTIDLIILLLHFLENPRLHQHARKSVTDEDHNLNYGDDIVRCLKLMQREYDVNSCRKIILLSLKNNKSNTIGHNQAVLLGRIIKSLGENRVGLKWLSQQYEEK